VVKEEGQYTFVEVFLIVSLIIHENEKKIYFRKKSPLVLLPGQQVNPIGVQMSYSERNRRSEMTVGNIPLLSHMSGELVICQNMP
jgi:hypothetical protein